VEQSKKDNRKGGFFLRLTETQKNNLEEKARLSGKTQADFLISLIPSNEKRLDQPQLSTNLPLPQIPKQVMEEDKEPEVYTCLWRYREYIGDHFELAICEPKSQDNRLTVKDIFHACRLCPIWIKNSRMLKAFSQRAGNIASQRLIPRDQARPSRASYDDAEYSVRTESGQEASYTDEDLNICDICKAKFSSYLQLLKHKKEAHGNDSLSALERSDYATYRK
jgi:hypothetical protein